MYWASAGHFFRYWKYVGKWNRQHLHGAFILVGWGRRHEVPKASMRPGDPCLRLGTASKGEWWERSGMVGTYTRQDLTAVRENTVYSEMRSFGEFWAEKWHITWHVLKSGSWIDPLLCEGRQKRQGQKSRRPARWLLSQWEKMLAWTWVWWWK